MSVRKEEYDSDEWRQHALCKGIDTRLFYPHDDNGESIADYRLADVPGNPGAYCFNCVVSQQCLNYAIATENRFGIFGATNEMQRNRLINIAIDTRRRENRKRRRPQR